jgi:hypothetical protein
MLAVARNLFFCENFRSTENIDFVQGIGWFHLSLFPCERGSKMQGASIYRVQDLI